MKIRIYYVLKSFEMKEKVIPYFERTYLILTFYHFEVVAFVFSSKIVITLLKIILFKEILRKL